jgi:uncharacterized protein DUF4189
MQRRSITSRSLAQPATWTRAQVMAWYTRPRALGRLLIAGLILWGGGVPAQSVTDPGQACAGANGYAGCSGSRGTGPEVVNEDWNAIAYSPTHYIAAWAGSFTAPENAKAAAMKGCAAKAPDCRIVMTAHDVCIGIAYERSSRGLFKVAAGPTQLDVEKKVLPLCMSEGRQLCGELARCSGKTALYVAY